MNNKTIRFAQVSDCHLFSDPSKLLNEINPDENATGVLSMVAADRDFDYLLLSGDVADCGEPAAYDRISKKIELLNLACYYVPGNHDNFENMQQHLKGHNIRSDRQFIVDNWQFILLNSCKPNSVEGYLPKEQLDFLNDCLEKHPDLFSVVVLHHHPILTDSFMDKVMLKNSSAFFEVINKKRNIRAVLFGHIHQVLEALWGDILFLSAPATAYQIKPWVPSFIVDILQPGYRWLEFEYNGNIKTGISRLP